MNFQRMAKIDKLSGYMSLNVALPVRPLRGRRLRGKEGRREGKHCGGLRVSFRNAVQSSWLFS